MNKFIIIIIGILILFSCNKKESADISTNISSYNDKNFYAGSTLNIKLNTEEKIDSFYISLNDKKLKSKIITLDTIHAKYGYNTLSLKVYYNGKEYSEDAYITVLSSQKEKKINFKLVKTYPHNITSFTEGLFLHNGLVYESSGLRNKSKLFTYNLTSGKEEKEIDQDPKIFSEGIAILNDTIYQLTYQERKVLVYKASDLSMVNVLDIPSLMKEGWGATTMENKMIFSDGTQNLFFVDNQMNITKTIQVVGNQKVYTYVNELEYHNGKIYANIWQENIILVINPKNGVVEQYIDLSDIVKAEKANQETVLNGIAIHNGNLIITGKYWKNNYEIALIP